MTISATTENERKVPTMAEYIKQKIQGGKKSICDSCTHRNVCKAIDNQPCTECNHYQCTADVEQVQQWIPVYDEFPEVGGYVVCIAKRNPFSRFMPMVARIEKNGWVNPITEQYISEVTHWMKIPQPPKGE